MMLEAVWLKDGKEIYKVSPVMNLMCDDNMEIWEIEVYDGNNWHSCEENQFEADDFKIRINTNN